jgi:hypothetical protein
VEPLGSVAAYERCECSSSRSLVLMAGFNGDKGELRQQVSSYTILYYYTAILRHYDTTILRYYDTTILRYYDTILRYYDTILRYYDAILL